MSGIILSVRLSASTSTSVDCCICKVLIMDRQWSLESARGSLTSNHWRRSFHVS